MWNKQVIILDKSFSMMSAITKTIDANPICISWFSDGNIFCVGTCSGSINFLNKDGVFINKIDNLSSSWITSISTKSNSNELSYGDLNGNFTTLIIKQKII